MTHFRSTAPGFKNQHGQIVIARTGFPSDSFPGQTIYRLRCSHCGHNYGSNGCDIHLRRCPSHQNGSRGERLPSERPGDLFANLFSTESV